MSAPQAPERRLVNAALRCYPARWRRRHADEAAELTALLIRDGVPAASIAWSFLVGAAREWLTPRPGRSLSTAAASLLAVACLLGASVALVAETVPAKAAGTTQSPAAPVTPTIKPTPAGVDASSPRESTPCGPVLPGRVIGALSVAGRAQLGIQGTGHVSSC